MEFINVIIINGLGGVGKSEFISQCKKVAETMDNTKVYELSTVDFVKKIAKECGWDGGKTQKDRIFLSDLKIAMGKWGDLPIKGVFNSIEEILKKEPNCNHNFFVNAREPEDIARIIDLANEQGYGILTLLVTNPNVKSNEVPELVKGITQISYDVSINNNGTKEELYEVAKKFMNFLKGED